MAATFHTEGSRGQNTSVNPLSIGSTQGLTITAGDSIVVSSSWDQASTTTPTVATSGGTGSDTFTLIYGPFTNAASGVKYAAWLLQTAGTGRTGVDVTWASSTPSFGDATATSFSGLTNVTLDQTAVATGNNGASSLPLSSGNTATLSSADEFAVGYAQTNGLIDSGDAPWTSDGQIPSTGSWAEHQVLTATTAVQSNFHGRNNWLSFVLTFMAGAATVDVDGWYTPFSGASLYPIEIVGY